MSTAEARSVEATSPPAPLWRWVLTAVLVLILAVTIRWSLLTGDASRGGWRLLAGLMVAYALFGAAALAVRGLRGRAVMVLIVGGAALLWAAALAQPPQLTNDFYRYTWDGRVSSAGMPVYEYPPIAPELAELRTPWLFPATCAEPAGDPPVCTRMNHPTVVTIYPPVAQAYFWTVHQVTRPLGPDGGRDRTWQVMGVILAGLTTLVLLRLSRDRPWRVALWAWCPTVAVEAVGNGHVDALAALLLVIGLGAFGYRRKNIAGVVLGLAVATKFLPALALVGVVDRRWRTPWLVLVTVLATYIPFVLQGANVFGFLGGYLAEEGYSHTERVRAPLLNYLLPDQIVTVTAALIVVGTALWLAFGRHQMSPWTRAAIMISVMFTVGGVTYPWYALILVAVIVMSEVPQLLVIAAAAYPGYLAVGLHTPGTATIATSYGIALVLLAAWWLATRYLRDRHAHGNAAAAASASSR